MIVQDSCECPISACPGSWKVVTARTEAPTNCPFTTTDSFLFFFWIYIYIFVDAPEYNPDPFIMYTSPYFLCTSTSTSLHWALFPDAGTVCAVMILCLINEKTDHHNHTNNTSSNHPTPNKTNNCHLCPMVKHVDFVLLVVVIQAQFLHSVFK